MMNTEYEFWLTVMGAVLAVTTFWGWAKVAAQADQLSSLKDDNRYYKGRCEDLADLRERADREKQKLHDLIYGAKGLIHEQGYRVAVERLEKELADTQDKLEQVVSNVYEAILDDIKNAPGFHERCEHDEDGMCRKCEEGKNDD